jgi:hypothetical protein
MVPGISFLDNRYQFCLAWHTFLSYHITLVEFHTVCNISDCSRKFPIYEDCQYHVHQYKKG